VLTSSTSSKTEQPLSMVAHRLSVHQHHAERTPRPLSMVAHCLSHDPREAETEEKSTVDENQQEEKEEMVDQPVSNHDQDQQEETVDRPENQDENLVEEKEEMVDQPVSNHDQDQQKEAVDQPESHDEKEEMFDQPLSMVAHCVALYQQHLLINHDSAEEKPVISYSAESEDHLTENMGQQGKDDVITSGNVDYVEVAPCGSDDSHQQLTQQLHNSQPAADQKASDIDDSKPAAEGEKCMIEEADSMQNGGQIEDQATKEVAAVEVERLGGVTASRRESNVEEEDLESAVVFTLSLGQLQLHLFLHSFSVQNCC
jgi:hypothetical protein